MELKGEDELYNKKMLKGRVTQVHRPLASGSAVAKQNMVLINEDGGYIIPKGGKTEELVRQAICQAEQESPEDFNRSTPSRVEGGVYVFDMWTHAMDQDESDPTRQAEL